ncbi:hypothetical protein HOLleu_02491 [Holothuria leucospilota]|uniref:Uncharacterized protein n=1 Tax=Holothuria leucospilota TaxID=206669 RepID=A0A9Q1CQR7_HOLLE|nr:hypothetical protein HOLleu_02491 [Holothuria leucospilota]
MKLVKSDWRSCLSSQILTCLIRIILQGPSIENFDPEAAITLWNTSALRARSPFQAPYRTDSSSSV